MGMLNAAAHRTGLLWFQTACQIACHALKELPFYLGSYAGFSRVK